MVQANVDVGVFQEKNLTDGIYTRGSDGYRVVATPAPSQYRGRVALFYRDYPNFSVEAIRQFGANIIACQLEMGERSWYWSRAAGGRAAGEKNTGPLGGDVPEYGT